MNQHRLLGLLLVLGTLLLLRAGAGEFEIKTADGQTIQGEFIGTEDGNVKLKTKYGELKVATKDVVKMTAVEPKPEPGDEQPAAQNPAPDKAVAPPRAPAEQPKEIAKPQPAAPTLTFPEARMPDPVALANDRAQAEGPPPTPSKQEFLQITRALSNFADAAPAARRKYVSLLQTLGRMVDPYVERGPDMPMDLSVRVLLLESLAVPGRYLTTPVFSRAHSQALSEFNQTSNTTPPPPDPFNKVRPLSREDLKQIALVNVLSIEEYISTAGGPYNTLFLLDLYRKRYTSEKTDPLLLGLARDRKLLAEAADDAARNRSGWDRDSRVGVIELALPMLFKGDETLASLVQPLLVKLLPTTHPKWKADEETWVEWWRKAEPKIK